jgi:hypothetical protein
MSTYLKQMSLIGQIDTFNKIMEIYNKEKALDLLGTVTKLIVRCQVGANVVDQL